MFDAERLLGGMIKRRVRRKSPRMVRKMMRPGFGTGTGAVLGMGAIGLAFAAFEHFSEKKAAAPPPPPPGSPRPPSPPPPPPGSPAASPPPPPGSSAAAPLPPPPAASDSARQETALLLIRAMIAAAHADGQLDEKERSGILSQVEEAGLGDEERQFLEQELDQPRSLDSLFPFQPTPELSQQVYAACLLAIDVDTQAERDFLQDLAQRLGLNESTRKEIEARFEGGGVGS